uniref:Uncharacterized protein n=1 Tax=viral metagenome TaxID=1070528 RepID=A0A6M3J664_9ZZZZ
MKLKFWVWLMRYAWRRARAANGNQIPDGVPGVRSVADPCDAYEPRNKRKGGWQGYCGTDGHYLCAECYHKMEVDNAVPSD